MDSKNLDIKKEWSADSSGNKKPPLFLKCKCLFKSELYIGHVVAYNGNSCWFKCEDGDDKVFSGKYKFTPIEEEGELIEKDNFIRKYKGVIYIEAINGVSSISMRQSSGEEIASAVLGWLYDRDLIKNNK